MANCVICNCEVSNGAFGTKDKFELTNHSFICRNCANKIGIKSIWSAAMYTAEKAKKKYFEMYPEEVSLRRSKDDLDKAYIIREWEKGNRLEAFNYIKSVAGIGSNDASYYIDKIIREADEEFIEKMKAIPMCYTLFTNKELKYLRSVLSDDEEVLHVVSGIMQQNEAVVSASMRVVGNRNPSDSRTWLMALTEKRIILINRHLLVGTEYIEIPLDQVNSISFQTRTISSSITIMHGSAGLIIDNITKGGERAFIDRANKAMKKVRASSVNTSVNPLSSSESSPSLSAADELMKWKNLLDQGVITQEEFNQQKAKLL